MRHGDHGEDSLSRLSCDIFAATPSTRLARAVNEMAARVNDGSAQSRHFSREASLSKRTLEGTSRMPAKIIALILLLALGACASAPPPMAQAPVAQAPAVQAASAPTLIRAPLVSARGVTSVIVGIGPQAIAFPFVLDSGASDVSISPNTFRSMVKGNLVTREDMISVVKYRQADGSIREGITFRLPVLTIGGQVIRRDDGIYVMQGGTEVRDVIGSVSEGTPDDFMLLGQTFLRRFRFWAIDNNSNQLVLRQ
jgi:hypothetical protein